MECMKKHSSTKCFFGILQWMQLWEPSLHSYSSGSKGLDTRKIPNMMTKEFVNNCQAPAGSNNRISNSNLEVYLEKCVLDMRLGMFKRKNVHSFYQYGMFGSQTGNQSMVFFMT